MIEISNFLDGVNLCNIFASIVVDEINKKSPNAVTEISVTDVGNFYVIKGITSSKDVNNVFQDFIKNYPKRFKTSIRLFDLIEYDITPDSNQLLVNYQSIKSNTLNDFQEFINNSAINDVYYNLSVCKKNKIVFYECSDEDVNQSYYDIEKLLVGYRYIRHNKIKKVYTSDRYYGLSNNGEKLYHILLKNIKHCLFMMGISNKLDITLSSDISLKEINNETIGIDIQNSTSIVNKEWLESLLLDVFPFSLKELEEFFDLNNYSSKNEILKNDSLLPWQKLDLVKEIILV